MRRARPVLLVVPVLALVLSGCVGEPEPAETPLSPEQACAALEEAVGAFYEVAWPGSTVEALTTFNVPKINNLRVPKPDCAFKVSPDPAVTPGDVFTLESFYLDYDEEMTVTLPVAIEAAGFRKDGPFNSWAASKLNRSYSAAIQVFAPEDGQPYSTAAEHFRVLDLTVGQN